MLTTMKRARAFLRRPHVINAPTSAPACIASDPTLVPPPSYTKERADYIYGEAFRRCIEYVKFTGITGDILEFGTYHGYTGRLMASLMAEFNIDDSIWLYDSFEGLPDCNVPGDADSYEVKTNKVWLEGAMRVEAGLDQRIHQSLARILPASQVHVIKGFFDQTFENLRPKRKVSIVHVDCDLYSSAKYVLDKLLEFNLLQDGCLLLFDDYNCNRANPNMGERRALTESFASQSRFTVSPFFTYAWSAAAFFVHDGQAS